MKQLLNTLGAGSILFVCTIAHAAQFDIKQITFDESIDHYRAVIYNNNVAWYESTGTYSNIAYWDGTYTGTQANITQVTNQTSYKLSTLDIYENKLVWNTLETQRRTQYWEGGEVILLAPKGFSPAISSAGIAWQDLSTGNYQICYWDTISYNGGQPASQQITHSPYGSPNPDIDENGHIIFRTAINTGSPTRIELWDGSQIIQLPTNTSLYNRSPRINELGTKAVWNTVSAGDPDIADVSYYDGSQTIVLSDGTGNYIYYDISDDTVAWTGKGNVYYWDGSFSGSSPNITVFANILKEYSAIPKLYGNKLVFEGFDGNDNEIFLYDGIEIVQITDNTYDDYQPNIFEDTIVWSGAVQSRYQIFMATSSSIPEPLSLVCTIIGLLGLLFRKVMRK